MAEPFTLYKLIVLYMLSKVNFPLTNSQISDFVLGKEYTNYFTLQQTLSELVDSDLVRQESTHNSTLYRITSQGEQTLEFFGDKISEAIKKEVLTYLDANEMTLKNEISISSDFFVKEDSNYAVRCQIKESENVLLEVSMNVKNKEQAEAICTNWKTQSDEVYAYLMDMLVR